MCIVKGTDLALTVTGSLQGFCIMFVGFLSGPVFDAGHLKILLLSGSFMVVFGHMMLSLAQNYWQALLAQGFCVGIGSGLLFVPSVAIMPSYFTKHVGLSIGIAASGSSIGGIIYPIAFYKLIDQIGFAWGVRVLGFIALATLLVPIFCMRQRVKPTTKRALLDISAFTDPLWVSFVVIGTIGFIAVYTVIIYLSFYAQAAGITSTEMAFYLVPILNAGSVIGRVLPNVLGDMYGSLNVMVRLLSLDLSALANERKGSEYSGGRHSHILPDRCHFARSYHCGGFSLWHFLRRLLFYATSRLCAYHKRQDENWHSYRHGFHVFRPRCPGRRSRSWCHSWYSLEQLIITLVLSFHLWWSMCSGLQCWPCLLTSLHDWSEDQGQSMMLQDQNELSHVRAHSSNACRFSLYIISMVKGASSMHNTGRGPRRLSRPAPSREASGLVHGRPGRSTANTLASVALTTPIGRHRPSWSHLPRTAQIWDGLCSCSVLGRLPGACFQREQSPAEGMPSFSHMWTRKNMLRSL